jgi:hypothetical protein
VKPRQIVISVAALAVVVVLLVVFGRTRSSSRGAGSMVDQLVVPGFVPDKARLIEITKAGSDTVRVRKTDDGWTVESAWGYAADPTRVNDLLRAIEELRVRDVRSTRPASHAAFQVDDAGGVWVHVYDGQDKQLAYVCAGKAVEYDRCFVRASGSNAVVEATPNLLQKLGAGGPDRTLEPTFLVQKTVTRFDADTVRRVTLQRGDETVVLEKTEAEEPGVNPDTGEAQPETVTKWMIRQPAEEEADENACRSMVNAFSGMMATGIGGGRTLEECGLDPPDAKVTLEFDEESKTAPVTLLFGQTVPESNHRYVVRGEEGARIFVVLAYYRDLAAKNLNELRRVKHEETQETMGEAGADTGEAGADTGEAGADTGKAGKDVGEAGGDAGEPDEPENGGQPPDSSP